MVLVDVGHLALRFGVLAHNVEHVLKLVQQVVPEVVAVDDGHPGPPLFQLEALNRYAPGRLWHKWLVFRAFRACVV